MNKNDTNLIIGKSGVGKTKKVFEMVEKIIGEGENLFILDNKEEYYNKFYEDLVNNGYNVKRINLREPKLSNSLNILAYPYQLYKENNKDAAIVLVLSIVENICVKKYRDEDPFWENNAAMFLASLILKLFEEQGEENVNFIELGKFIYQLDIKEEFEKLKDYFTSLDVLNPIYKMGSSTMFAPMDTRGGIIVTLKERVNKFFDRETILQVLSECDFKIEDFKEKTALFFEGKGELNAVCNGILSEMLLFNKQNERIINLILDDFNSLPKFKEMDEIVNYAPLNKVRTLIITNCLEELESLYGTFTFKKFQNILNLEKIKEGENSENIEKN